MGMVFVFRHSHAFESNGVVAFAAIESILHFGDTSEPCALSPNCHILPSMYATHGQAPIVRITRVGQGRGTCP